MSSGKGENNISQSIGNPHAVRIKKGSRNILRGYPESNHAPNPIAKLTVNIATIERGFSGEIRRPFGLKITAKDTSPMRMNPIPATSLVAKRLRISRVHFTIMPYNFW
ncbi:MAG: hypothetical protein ACFFCW_42625 [Candidatus Hodarchaeota archaeon]